MTEFADTTTIDSAELPGYPMVRDGRCPFNPPQHLLDLNADGPLHRVRIWNGAAPWLVTGYDEARALFADPRVSVDDHQDGFPYWNEGMQVMARKRAASLVTADGEHHTRFRRMLSKPFTVKRIEAMRPLIQQITDDHIDAMLAGPKPADIVTALALPIPSLVISKLLGVPYEDAEFFQESATNGLARYATADDAAKSGRSLFTYLRQLVESKIEQPAEDAVSDIAERVKIGELTLKEAAQAANTLLIGGHETTGNMISLGVLALLEHPRQMAILRDTTDPKIISSAVEELLRYLSIIHNGQRRVATEDIAIAGEVIRRGEGIIIDLVPANWDPTVFDDPGQLNLQRPEVNKHMGFGYGRHQCIGQSLARVELQIVFSTLLKRIPTLQLAVPLDQVPLKHDRLAYGAYELPVSW
ncbi:cytochrome P450 [Mycobacterium ahvazicum]|uniref:Cytochrome P450 n=1 Tax=Mycobacterium ahvazicum TaxID=1964395 RepID=A0A2K4YH19_9MYCO|nr:cytochrome P450 [Mycobacterium ahvazicum]SOX56070.1 cytochrome P450 [Mycobacterium ahvazicum]